MSDTPDNNQGTPNQADPINNIKQEFSRKLGNVESQVSALTEANKQLLAQLQNLTPQAPSAKPTESIDDIWFSNPTEAAAKISHETEVRIERKMAAQQQAQVKQQQTIASLVRDYPELNDESNPLTKRAVEIYMGLDDSDKASPMAYKLAVKEAAMEMEVKPASKRSYDESYSMGTSGSYNAPQGRKSGDKIEDATLAFARALGQPVDDPKYIERLKSAVKRKNWSKYE